MTKLNDASQYVSDILNLAASLDAVTEQDDLPSITRALIQGKEQYFDLVFHRLSLDFTPKENAIVLWMMDVVQARLSGLERLRYQKLPQSGSFLRKSRHTGSWV